MPAQLSARPSATEQRRRKDLLAAVIRSLNCKFGRQSGLVFGGGRGLVLVRVQAKGPRVAQRLGKTTPMIACSWWFRRECRPRLPGLATPSRLHGALRPNGRQPAQTNPPHRSARISRPGRTTRPSVARPLARPNGTPRAQIQRPASLRPRMSPEDLVIQTGAPVRSAAGPGAASPGDLGRCTVRAKFGLFAIRQLQRPNRYQLVSPIPIPIPVPLRPPGQGGGEGGLDASPPAA